MQPPPALGRGRRRSHGDRVSADLDTSWERAPAPCDDGRAGHPGAPPQGCRGAAAGGRGGRSLGGRRGLARHTLRYARRELSAPDRAPLSTAPLISSPDAMAVTRLASLSRGGIRGVRHGENVLELEQERFQPFKKGQEVGGFAGHGLGRWGRGRGKPSQHSGTRLSLVRHRVAFSRRGGPGTLCTPTARPSESRSLQMILVFFPRHSARGWRQKFRPSFPGTRQKTALSYASSRNRLLRTAVLSPLLPTRKRPRTVAGSGAPAMAMQRAVPTRLLSLD